MSTPETGDAAVVKGFVDDAKALLAAAATEEEQLDLLEAPTAEEMLDAREDLGPNAGRMAVLRHARETRKRGRPPGSRNRRTDDLAKYLLGFGPDPAVTLMQISATAEEVMMENSRRKVTKVLKGGKDKPDTLVEIEEETLSYEGARSMRIRCAEALLPYFHGKKPVTVDLSFSGVADLLIEGVTHTRAEISDIVDGDFLAIDGPDKPE